MKFSLFLKFLHFAVKVAKNYTFAGEVLNTFAGVLRMLAKYYTFTGDRFWAIFTYAGEVLYVCWRFLRKLAKYYTFAGVLRMLAFYVCWRYGGGGGGYPRASLLPPPPHHGTAPDHINIT